MACRCFCKEILPTYYFKLLQIGAFVNDPTGCFLAFRWARALTLAAFLGLWLGLALTGLDGVTCPCMATGWLLPISQLSSSLLAKQNGNNNMNRSSIVYIVAYVVLYDQHIPARWGHRFDFSNLWRMCPRDINHVFPPTLSLPLTLTNLVMGCFDFLLPIQSTSCCTAWWAGSILCMTPAASVGRFQLSFSSYHTRDSHLTKMHDVHINLSEFYFKWYFDDMGVTVMVNTFGLF